MNLLSVEIKNYRSVKHETISFDPPCRILVGINESGKSNILKALALLGANRAPSRKDLREILPNEDEITEAYVQFFFRLTKGEAEEVYDDVTNITLAKQANPKLLAVGNAELSIRQLCALYSEFHLKVDVFEEKKKTLPSLDLIGRSLAGVWATPTDECPSDFTVHHNGEAVALSQFKFVQSNEYPEIPSEYLKPLTVNETVGHLVSAITKAIGWHLPTVIFWQYDEKNLLPSQIDLDEFAAKPSSCAPLRNMFELAGISDIKGEIARVKLLSINQIQNFLNRIAAKTTDHFKSVWKEYRGIEFQLRLNANAIIPAIKEQNSFDFSKRSDGFKRFVTFLLMISVTVKTDSLTDSLLLIDEPDSGLHPSGARYLRDELVRISKKNYVAYSTHSIFMIDVENIDRHYIVKKKNEITSITAAEDSNIADEEVLYNALGHSVFATLKEKNIIFEGWKDKKLFQVAITKLAGDEKKKLKDVGLCHAKGAKHIRAITPMMELANRKCLIISDSDAPAIEQKKLFNADRGYGAWYVYQDLDPALAAITGEDFIKSDHIAAQTNSIAETLALSRFPASVISGESGKLRKLEEWFKIQGLDSTQAREAVRRVKELTFDKLAARDVEDSYYRLLAAVLTALAA